MEMEEQGRKERNMGRGGATVGECDGGVEGRNGGCICIPERHTQFFLPAYGASSRNAR